MGVRNQKPPILSNSHDFTIKTRGWFSKQITICCPWVFPSQTIGDGFWMCLPRISHYFGEAIAITTYASPCLQHSYIQEHTRQGPRKVGSHGYFAYIYWIWSSLIIVGFHAEVTGYIVVSWREKWYKLVLTTNNPRCCLCGWFWDGNRWGSGPANPAVLSVPYYWWWVFQLHNMVI